MRDTAVFISPTGRRARIKGGSGPLFDEFFDINRHEDGYDLRDSAADLARAYAVAVWVYRCIKVRADAVAAVPLVLVDGSEEPVDAHPLLDMLADVNPYTMNRGDLLRATESAYNIWGRAYWLLERRGLVPKWIQWLNPQTMTLELDGPKIGAFVQRVGGTTRRFAPEDVVYFRNFNPFDDVGGLSPLSVALGEVNADLNAVRFVSAFFLNDARPGGLLWSEQRISDAEIERTRTWWEKLFKGVRNKWKTGIVGGGLKWQEIGYPLDKLALKELREEDRRAICAVFGVPAGLAGAWEQANYATAKEQKASFYEDTILPQLDYLAEVLNFALVPQYPDLVQRKAKLRWDTSAVAALQESTDAVAERVARLFEANLITRNEAREEVGLDPLDGEEGEAFAAATKPVPPPSPFGLGQEPPQQQALEELEKAKRFHLKRRKPGRPFRWEHVPAPLAEAVERGLKAAETDEAIRDVFRAARAKLLMEPAAVLPSPEVTDEDIEAAERHWREYFGDDPFAEIIDAEPEPES